VTALEYSLIAGVIVTVVTLIGTNLNTTFNTLAGQLLRRPNRV
jgi:Flp pilus assembly pilin Flp